MTEFTSFFQSYFVNQTFFATLLLITINNIWRRMDITVPLKIIKYVLITSSVILIIQLIFQYFSSNMENNAITFLNRATGSYWFYYLLILIFSMFFPFLLLIPKLGRNKYIILLIAFLINFGFWFERFVIIVTSLHRGHMPASWSMYYNWEGVLILFLLIMPLVLLIFNITIDIIKKIKK